MCVYTGDTASPLNNKCPPDMCLNSASQENASDKKGGHLQPDPQLKM